MSTETKAPSKDAPYGGRSKWTNGKPRTTGFCDGGIDGPNHNAAHCQPMSWSPSVGRWTACACSCHDDDLNDAQYLAEVIAEAAEREYAWRTGQRAIRDPEEAGNPHEGGPVTMTKPPKGERKAKTFPTEWTEERGENGIVYHFGAVTPRKYAPKLSNGAPDEGHRIRYACTKCDSTGKWYREEPQAVAKAGEHEGRCGGAA